MKCSRPPLLRKHCACPAGAAQVVYVHDDNLGSHAHYELVDSEEKDGANHRKLLLRRGALVKATFHFRLEPKSNGWISKGARALQAAPAAVFTAPRCTYVESLRLNVPTGIPTNPGIVARVHCSNDLGVTWIPAATGLCMGLTGGSPVNGTTAELGPLELRSGQQLALRIESVGSKSALDACLELVSGPSVPNWEIDDWRVVGALVPKPDKVRLPVEDLFLCLHDVRNLLGLKVFGGIEIDYETRICTGVDYRTELLPMGLDRSDLRHFLEEVALPRHVGVITLSDAGTPLCDLVLDVTEVSRDPRVPPVLAVVARGVARHSPAHNNLLAIATKLEWELIGQSAPVVTGPDTDPTGQVTSSL